MGGWGGEAAHPADPTRHNRGRENEHSGEGGGGGGFSRGRGDPRMHFIEAPCWTIYSLSHKISTLTAVQTKSGRLPAARGRTAGRRQNGARVSTLLGERGGNYRVPRLASASKPVYTVITGRYQGEKSQRCIPCRLGRLTL